MKDYDLEKRRLVISGIAIVIIVVYVIRLFALQIMSDEGAQVMEHCFREGKQVHAKFVYPDASYQIGWAYITEFTRDNPHDGIATIKATMEGVGEISEITAAGGN